MKIKKKRVKLLFICSFLLFVLILIFQKLKQNQPIFVDLNYSLTTLPTCDPSQEWIELDGETFLRKNTSKYFLDEKNFVFIFTCRAESLNNKKFEFYFTIKYQNKIFQKFNANKYELIRFFNIRHYQNFVLKAHLDLDEFINKESIIDLAELSIETIIHLKSLNRNSLKTSSSTIKTSIGNFRNRKNSQRNAIICTEPLFLEEKDAVNLQWWIEMTKEAGYKKLVIFNNSIVNTPHFENIFASQNDYVEVIQFWCLPNLINPQVGQYLRHYKQFMSDEWDFATIHFLALDGIANNECLYANSFESNLVMIQDNDESFLVPKLDNLDTIQKGSNKEIKIYIKNFLI
jgi:hypothetical protein